MITRCRMLALGCSVAFASLCVSPAASGAPRLPSWLQVNMHRGDGLRLVQDISRDGDHLEICVSLINASSANMVLLRIEPRGSNFGQLLTFMLDTSGNPIAPNDNVFHQSSPPPPEIGQGAPDDFQTLSPGTRVSHCGRLQLPREPSHFWVVSSYTPRTETNEFPTSLSPTTVLISRQYGSVRSNLCEITARRIRCLAAN